MISCFNTALLVSYRGLRLRLNGEAKRAPIVEAAYNESQQKAIEDSRKVEGITLVQGPPGTGKTHTVLGILAVLLNSSAQERKAPPRLAVRGNGGG